MRQGWREPNLRHPPACGGVGRTQDYGSHTCVCSPESFPCRLATNRMIQQISRTRMCQRLSALPVIPLPESERRWFDVLFFSAHSEYSEDLTGKKKESIKRRGHASIFKNINKRIILYRSMILRWITYKDPIGTHVLRHRFPTLSGFFW